MPEHQIKIPVEVLVESISISLGSFPSAQVHGFIMLKNGQRGGQLTSRIDLREERVRPLIEELEETFGHQAEVFYGNIQEREVDRVQRPGGPC